MEAASDVARHPLCSGIESILVLVNFHHLRLNLAKSDILPCRLQRDVVRSRDPDTDSHLLEENHTPEDSSRRRRGCLEAECQ